MTNTETTGSGKLALPNPVYDVAKDVTTLYLPASAVLYATLAGVWHWGYATEVALTVAGIVTFLGVVLKLSTNSYRKSDKSNDGVLVVDNADPLTDRFSVEPSIPLDEIAGVKTITLKVEERPGSLMGGSQ